MAVLTISILYVRFVFMFIFFCSLVTAPLHQNWLKRDIQGVNNTLTTSSQPGTACDFAVTVHMALHLGPVCGAAAAGGFA